MRGVYSDHEDDRTAGQPAHVLSAWIGDLLGEADRDRLHRLKQLRTRLQSHAFEWDNALLAQAIASLHAAGRELRFLDLRHGWFARSMGRHRAGFARFLSALERIESCVRDVRKHAADLGAEFKGHASGARRLLVELDIEWQALNGEVDQGVTWLQDMCSQISDARAEGRDDRQLERLAESAQSYTQEFKRLQGVSTMARDIAIRGHNVLERRAALLEQVKGDLERFDKNWKRQLEPVSDAAKSAQAATVAVPKAIEAHDELMKRLSATADACTALQHEEHLMAQHLSMMNQELEKPRG